MNNAIICDTPETINAFALLSFRSRLKLEIAGMRHSSGLSMSKYLKDRFGFKGNKAKVLEQYEAYLREQGVLS